MKFRKIIAFLLILTMSTSVTYASSATDSNEYFNLPDDMPYEEDEMKQEDVEESIPNLEPTEVESDNILDTSLKATPSEATPPKGNPPETHPSKATPSEVIPSEATPSEATPSQIGTPTIEVRFQASQPDDIPSWYVKTKRRIFKGKSHYYFIDRFGQEQHRIYGFYEDGSDADWYECDEKGKVTNANQMIDLDWEDMVIAPLRWESIEPMPEDVCSLSSLLYGAYDQIENMDFEVIDPELGQNYDGTFYDIWWLGSDLSAGSPDVRYYLYGRAANGDMDARWLECTEDGTVMEKVDTLIPPIIPLWYKELSLDGLNYYFFLDRDGQQRYRRYTVQDGVIGWYACDAEGNPLDDGPIDTAVEDLDLAPYRYESAAVKEGELAVLSGILTGDETELQFENTICMESHGKNYDDTSYDVWQISLPEDDDGCLSFYLYGYPSNSHTPEKQWYKCDEKGTVLGDAVYEEKIPAIETLSLSRGADVFAEECHLTGWNTDVTILAARTMPNGGRLIIDCGLAKKYGNQVAIYSYLGSSNTKHKVILFYKANPTWTNLTYYSASWAEGYRWVYAPIDESAYWYARSGVNMSAHWNWTIDEINAGGYNYHSESEGTQWSPIPMKSSYFKMVINHTYGAWSITKAPTCTTNGVQKRYCSGCGRAETATLPALGHSYESRYYTEGNNGTYYRRCTRSGCTGKTDVKNNPYTVTYAANSGEGYMAPQPHTYNVAQTLQANTFSKDYHSFKCWARTPDGNSTTYTDRQSVQNLTQIYGDNVVLYAQWEPNTYEITYNDGFDGTQTLKKRKKYTEKLGPMPSFTRTGYMLSGFFTNQEGGDAITEQTYVPHSNVTYYARWVPIDFELLFHVQESFCCSTKKIITYDSRLGILPVPIMEDYVFLGWYMEPYSSIYMEGIMSGDSMPADGKKVSADIIYRTAGNTDVYAYMTLQYRRICNNMNFRPGKDGIFDTEDDNYFLDGPDGVAGTHDDIRVNPGLDGQHGTIDDYYVDEQGRNVYPGDDKIFGTEDDYRDNADGTNTRPGPDCSFNTPDDMDASNGLDRKPGTGDDWIDNGPNYPDTNLRPGQDSIFGTPNDEIYWNGLDLLPGTEDDLMIHPGMDQMMGTGDDWVDNGVHYPDTNLRPGQDGVFGTPNDEIYWNGPDGIPGNSDDQLILPGADGEYGTEDDCYDNSSEQDGTNIRPGADGVFGTDDDELWLNGSDGIPGTEDDEKYIPKHSGGGGGGKPTKPSDIFPEIPITLPEPLFPFLKDSPDSDGSIIYVPAYDRVNIIPQRTNSENKTEETSISPSKPEEAPKEHVEATVTGHSQMMVQEPNSLWGILKNLISLLLRHPIAAMASCLAVLLFIWFIIIVLRILTRKYHSSSHRNKKL